ncbi:unnamed protein product [Calypogeia fissa]
MVVGPEDEEDKPPSKRKRLEDMSESSASCIEIAAIEKVLEMDAPASDITPTSDQLISVRLQTISICTININISNLST